MNHVDERQGAAIISPLSKHSDTDCVISCHICNYGDIIAIIKILTIALNSL